MVQVLFCLLLSCVLQQYRYCVSCAVLCRVYHDTPVHLCIILVLIIVAVVQDLDESRVTGGEGPTGPGDPGHQVAAAAARSHPQ